jgi:tRNA-dihydrouridine synthase
LVVDSGHKNAASFLISQAIEMLKEKPCAIVSYADSAFGHSGIVYQATNWLYTGATVSHDSLYVIDGVPTHAMTIRDKYKITNPSEWAKENNISKIKPSQKHRYFYFVGSKNQKKSMREKLTYEVVSKYPKSEKTYYDAGELSCADCLKI